MAAHRPEGAKGGSSALSDMVASVKRGEGKPELLRSIDALDGREGLAATVRRLKKILGKIAYHALQSEGATLDRREAYCDELSRVLREETG